MEESDQQQQQQQWISVPKRTGAKVGRKFGLTGRQQAVVGGGQRPGPVKEPPTVENIDCLVEAIHQEHFDRSNSFDSALSEREIEDRFNVISLSIKTEALTLRSRLEHQHRQRDLVENNLGQEMAMLQSIFLVSN